jgi:hypothetical protein
VGAERQSETLVISQMSTIVDAQANEARLLLGEWLEAHRRFGDG